MAEKYGRTLERDVPQIRNGGSEDQQDGEQQKKNDDGDVGRMFDVVTLVGRGDGGNLDVMRLAIQLPYIMPPKIATGMETTMP